MKHNLKMGVLMVMSHLLITLAVLGIYAYTLYSGEGDETLKTVLTVIVGYWFGSMGTEQIQKEREKRQMKEKEREV